MQEINYPLLLDGGLSNQLESQGCNLDQPLWTAKILQTDPEAIVQAHLAYLEAGAQCIITASYQATIAGFIKIGIHPEEAKKLILKSVDLAGIAIERYQRIHPEKNKKYIAASIGPYGAFLADGSEYTGDYGLTDEELMDFHESRIALLDRSKADFLACETIPSYQEAKVLAEILSKCRKMAWMTFSCKNEKYINDGTSIEKCIELLNEHPQIFALGVNCTKPSYISDLIIRIKAHCKMKKVVIYPNSGEPYSVKMKSWVRPREAQFSTDLVKEWLRLGAEIVGGCCRVGPEQIAEIHTQFDEFK